MEDWSSLPQVPLISIMRYCSDQHRLTSCALVSSSWAAAAAAATSSVRTRQLQQCSTWAQQHGAHITSLHIPAAKSPGANAQVIAAFPALLLADLVELQINSSRPKLSALRRAAANKLQRLKLKRCTLLKGSAALLDTVAALPALQDLALLSISGPSRSDWLKLPSDLLPAVSQLTRLELSRKVVDQSLRHLSCLVNVQELDLCFLTEPTELRGIGQLTALRVLNLRDAQFQLSTSNTPGLAELTRLQELRLVECGVEPAVLDGISRLQHIELREVCFTQPDMETATAPAALSWLGQQQELTYLQLQHVVPLQHTSAACYTALTASSKLRVLDLDVQVPKDAWQHCFAPGLQRPSLTTFKAALHHAFSGADMHNMAQCCLSLRTLTLHCATGVVPSSFGGVPAPLLRLSQLTSLQLHVEDDASAAVLAQLTQLVSLCCLPPSDVSDVGLLSLTALTALTRLQAYQSSPGAALMQPSGRRLECLDNTVRCRRRCW